MSNAIWVAWRIPCSGLRLSSVLPPVTFRPVCRDLRITPSLYNSTSRRLISSLNTLCQTQNRPSTLRFFPRYFETTLPQRRSKKTAASAHPEPTSDSLLDKPLSDLEIRAIFGHRTKVSPELANRTLEVLQARRLEGTLDLDLPLDVARAVPQSQLDICLEWLRVNYPVDEDAAIMARIEREDREVEEKLVRRAEQLGLYKPQSGSYEAELGEEDSPYGKSVLKEAREQNEKYLLAEKERKRQKWLEGEKEEHEKLQRLMEENTSLQQYQESALTEARPRADPNERPYLAWVQKHHIAGTLNQPEAMEVTTTQRLMVPALFVLLTLSLCYYLATTYEPPARKDRLWPDIPPAAATVGAIIGANVAVTLMWKYIPPSWRLLNRFFVIVPFYPSAPSMIGSTFSHQTWRHLATNMMVLGLMGTRVHDELGRGNFLAIYFASGALGSLASLSRSVLLGYLGMTSLGASAATSGIVAAWCMYHANDKITAWILPHELRETLWTQGWIFLACLVATEVFSMVTPARFLSVFPLSRLTKMDHAAHLGGYFAGAGCGYALAQRKKAERIQRARDAKWFENLVR